MKTLSRHILESLEIDIFWLLDKWFERNENQKQEFMNIVAYCLNDKIPQTPKIKEYIKGTSLENDLKEFVNFIDNEVQSDINKDYYERLKTIIKQIIDFKDRKNTYIQKYKMGSY